MALVYDQKDLKKYVKLCKMTLNLSGIKEDKEIFIKINDSFTAESRIKLNGLGLIEGEYNLYDLEEGLNRRCPELTLEEEFAEPQKAHETVRQYLKRLTLLLPQMGDEAPSADEFLVIFEKGIHPNIKETVKTTITDQMKRLSRRSLKETMEQLDSTLKVIMDSSKDKILKPKNTCRCCNEKKMKDPFDLDEVEEACDDLD